MIDLKMDSTPLNVKEMAIGILLAHGGYGGYGGPAAPTGYPHRFLNGGRKPATSGQVKPTTDMCVGGTYTDISEE